MFPGIDKNKQAGREEPEPERESIIQLVNRMLDRADHGTQAGKQHGCVCGCVKCDTPAASVDTKGDVSRVTAPTQPRH